MAGSNDGGKVGLDSISNNFGNKLIGSVTEAYGFVVPQDGNIFTLRNQTDPSDIVLSGHTAGSEHFFAELDCFTPYQILIFLEKERVKAIWSKSI